jgi:rod shape-determining protein MreB
MSIRAGLAIDIAIDLGTANTLVYQKGKGLVFSEPSVVAVYRSDTGSDRVFAVGTRAKEMIGRTPGDMATIQPIRDGVIAGFETTSEMLRHVVRQTQTWRGARPRMVIGVPANLSEVERRAVKEAARQAGASEVFVIEEAIAAALGAGLDVTEPEATMVVDIGGGTTDIAVIACGGAIYSRSFRSGGDAMDEAIRRYVKQTYNLLIGERTAEQVKILVGCARKRSDSKSIEIKGRDLVADRPATLVLKSEEVSSALAAPVRAIAEHVRSSLAGIPPETCVDILETGILLTGGASLLTDLDVVLREATGQRVQKAENPLSAMVIGAGRCLEEPQLLERVAQKL